jgi:ribosomal protein S27E
MPAAKMPEKKPNSEKLTCGKMGATLISSTGGSSVRK